MEDRRRHTRLHRVMTAEVEGDFPASRLFVIDISSSVRSSALTLSAVTSVTRPGRRLTMAGAWPGIAVRSPSVPGRRTSRT